MSDVMSDRAGYAFGDFLLDTAQSRLLRREGSPVELTPRLFAALLVLVERAGELVDRETLLQLIWPGLVVGDNSVSQAIAGLRRILGDEAHGGRYIQTVPRKGFRFVAAVTRTAPARLAVLPFRVVGSQDRVDLLDVGMADSLIARLSVLPGIVVLAPPSAGAAHGHSPGASRGFVSSDGWPRGGIHLCGREVEDPYGVPCFWAASAWASIRSRAERPADSRCAASMAAVRSAHGSSREHRS
jgi:DNA-binding winged helix-turn-helix (wHTH) protein